MFEDVPPPSQLKRKFFLSLWLYLGLVWNVTIGSIFMIATAIIVALKIVYWKEIEGLVQWAVGAQGVSAQDLSLTSVFEILNALPFFLGILAFLFLVNALCFILILEWKRWGIYLRMGSWVISTLVFLFWYSSIHVIIQSSLGIILALILLPTLGILITFLLMRMQWEAFE